jgi:hypothetical protein
MASNTSDQPRFSKETQIGSKIISKPIFKIGEYAKKDWKTSDDSVFSRLTNYIDNEADKEVIQEFMNIYYYLIIRYSKACFKKHDNWQKQKFNYSLANELDCHHKLLCIQRQMSVFRRDFKSVFQKPVFYTPIKIAELLTFIKTEIKTLANVIYKPVSYISPHIIELIDKHKSEPARIYSSKINYEVYNAIMKKDTEPQTNTPTQTTEQPSLFSFAMEPAKMIVMTFKGGNARF